MKRYGVIALIAVLVLGLAIYFAACSGGGSNSGSSGTASVGAGASAASTAINSGTMALSATVGGSSSGAPLFRPQSLSAAVNAFYSTLQAKRANVSLLRAKMLAGTISNAPVSSLTVTCQTSGTWTLTLDVTSAPTTTTLILTYNNCVTDVYTAASGTIRTVWNGAFSIADSNNGSSLTFRDGDGTTPLTLKWIRLSDNTVVLNNSAMGTLTGSADVSTSITCTPVSGPNAGVTQTEYKRFTLTMDASLHYTGIGGSDFTGSAYNFVDSATSFTLDATSNLDGTCTATSGQIKESGAVAHTDYIDSKGNTSLDITSPLTLAWASVTGGDSYNLSGSFNMQTPCFTGSLTLATTNDIFVPTGATCPTAGVVTVSGTVNGSVVYTSSGGITIEDSQGTPVENYPTCDQAKGCV